MTLQSWSAEAAGWDAAIARLPGAHVLQTREWAEVKQAYGWHPLPQAWRDPSGQVEAAALVLERTVSPLKLRVLYVPRGPLLDWSDSTCRSRVLDDLQALARRRGAIFIKIDPEVILGRGVPEAREHPQSRLGQGCSRRAGPARLALFPGADPVPQHGLGGSELLLKRLAWPASSKNGATTCAWPRTKG